ncbi:MAG: hypothetical protein AAGJ95_09530 [Cyanobacteria bacterium J06554_11]
MDSTEKRLVQWFLTNRTGVSSKAIVAAITGCNYKPITRPCTPKDVSDFQRCLVLLTHIPEWKDRLFEVAGRYPEWKPFVDGWADLEELYSEERASVWASKTYQRLQALNDEAMHILGWRRVSQGHWMKA